MVIVETLNYANIMSSIDYLFITSKCEEKKKSDKIMHFISEMATSGVFTPNQISLTTIVIYLQKTVTEADFQTIGPLYLHAVWYLPFTNSLRKHTVTYHFSDLQEVYSGNRQIHTKCELQYLHPPHISTSGKCYCVIIHQTTKATEYIGYQSQSKYLHKSPLSHICTNHSLRYTYSV